MGQSVENALKEAKATARRFEKRATKELNRRARMLLIEIESLKTAQVDEIGRINFINLLTEVLKDSELLVKQVRHREMQAELNKATVDQFRNMARAETENRRGLLARLMPRFRKATVYAVARG